MTISALSRRRRQGLGVGFLVVAGLLVLASAAWACTTYLGVQTLSQSGQTSRTNTGDNDTSSTRFCDDAAGQTMTLQDATASFTVSWASTTSGTQACQDPLPTGTATIRHYNGSSDMDCHTLGTSFNETFSLSGSPPSGSAAVASSQLATGDDWVCVDKGAYGMAMAVSVI